MNEKEKAGKSAEILHQEVQQKASSGTLADAGRLNHYIPYFIAASFVAMTALLTLLLTMVMDNKAELDEVMSGRQALPEPILADARMAFGQGMDTGMQSDSTDTTPALLSDESAIAPEIPPSPVKPGTELTAKQSVTEEDSSHIVPGVKAEKILANPAQQLQATGTGGPIVSSRPSTAPADVMHDMPITAANPRLPTQNLAGSQQTPTAPIDDSQLATLESGNRQLEKIVSSHETQIRSFHKVLQQQSVNREEMQSVISQHMQLMESEIHAIEQILHPAIPSAVVGYDRMINRRRESFQRMMQRRDKMLQRAMESRHRLREDYTHLLNLLEDHEQLAQLVNQ